MLSQKKFRKSTPEKSKAVGFFDHFPRDFLRPYGRTNDAPTSETLKRRTRVSNCEWLRRPHYAMSVFSSAIHENLDLLQTEESTVMNSKKMKEQLAPLQKFVPSLRRLNSKADGQATKQDVTNILKMLYDENPNIDELMRHFFKVGGAMFLMSTQFMVAQNMLSSPADYASRLKTDDSRCNK